MSSRGKPKSIKQDPNDCLAPDANYKIQLKTKTNIFNSPNLNNQKKSPKNIPKVGNIKTPQNSGKIIKNDQKSPSIYSKNKRIKKKKTVTKIFLNEENNQQNNINNNNQKKEKIKQKIENTPLKKIIK